MEIDTQQTNELKPEETQRNVSKLPIRATIRINPKNFHDAYIDNPEGGQDILIESVASRNLALDGDLVEVKLNHVSKWKINFNTVANHWELWSPYLTPVIEELQNNEKKENVKTATQDDLQAQQNQSSETSELSDQQHELQNGSTKPTRHKREITQSKGKTNKNNKANGALSDGAKAQIVASKLPANLPSGIAKLRISHIINLPLSSQCIQKTGYVSQVIKRNHSGIAGGYLKEYSSEYALFSPTDSRIPRMLIDIQQCPLDFVTQSKRYKDILFIAQMSGWEESKNFATGNLVKIVGDSNTIESRLETMLIELGIYDTDFPSDAYRELDYLNALPANWFEENSRGRKDLTNECIFTIDPKTARDLDDAVSIRQISGDLYEVGVHIADVSYFVKEMSAVDYYARLRTTSVYLVDRVIPMLPRILCEQMCSLNPNEPKLTFSVIWKMNKYGHIIEEWFGRTIIKSCVKLAYEQAQDMIDCPGDISWIKEGENMPELYGKFDWNDISKAVVLLNMIAKNIRSRRYEEGALRIDQVKLKFELDSESKCPTGFAFEQRGEANFLIEEYMLLANMSVAKRIYKHDRNTAFLRRHPSSSVQLLKEVKEFCDAKGCPLDVTSAGSIQKSLNAIEDPTMAKVISFLLLRAMKNAEYICVGSLPANDQSFKHFALNVMFYTHFTSPIRRYADVIVHRQLAIALKLEQSSHEDIDSLSKMADECTKRKLSSKMISETSQKLYFNLFVQKAGFCELLACVTRIQDQSFDVILVDYNMSGRVYVDRLKDKLEGDPKFESFSGIKRLVLKWKPTITKSSKSKKNKKKKSNQQQSTEDQLTNRSDLEARKSFIGGTDFRVNQAIDDQQVIEVFDVVKVLVTVDEKDIGKLKIELKPPVP